MDLFDGRTIVFFAPFYIQNVPSIAVGVFSLKMKEVNSIHLNKIRKIKNKMLYIRT